jgi:flavin reductase (DIM6/NTAB) family NADH-FMN oxidoreductase RutF
MTPKRIGRHLEGGAVPDDERERQRRGEALRETLSHWASGVTIVAVRDAGKVHALTVSAFLPVSVEPPLVVVSLGGNASALPYLQTGTAFAISLLAASQRGLASRFADVFPVGPDPFVAAGPPVVRDAIASLICTVEEIRPAGDHYLVTARVQEAYTGPDAPALVYFKRGYGVVQTGA